MQLVARHTTSPMGTAQYSTGSIRCSRHTATRADDATYAEGATVLSKHDANTDARPRFHKKSFDTNESPLDLPSPPRVYNNNKKKMKCNGRALVGEKLSHLFTDTHTQVPPQQFLGDAICSGTVWPTLQLGTAEKCPVHTCCNNVGETVPQKTKER